MPELTGLGQVAIHVSDVASAVDFYRGVLGLRFLFSAGANLAFFDLWGVRLMIETAVQGKVGNNSVLYFRCPDLDAAYEEIRFKAGTVGAPHLVANMPDHELWMFFVNDLDGNLIGFMEERAPA